MAKSERERYRAALGSLKLSKEQNEAAKEMVRRCYAIIGQLLEQAGGKARLDYVRLLTDSEETLRIRMVTAGSKEEGQLPEYMFLSLMDAGRDPEEEKEEDPDAVQPEEGTT